MTVKGGYMTTESVDQNINYDASGTVDPSSKPLKETLPKDLLSGVVVALVALPLCEHPQGLRTV